MKAVWHHAQKNLQNILWMQLRAWTHYAIYKNRDMLHVGEYVKRKCPHKQPYVGKLDDNEWAMFYIPVFTRRFQHLLKVECACYLRVEEIYYLFEYVCKGGDQVVANLCDKKFFSIKYLRFWRLATYWHRKQSGGH